MFIKSTTHGRVVWTESTSEHKEVCITLTRLYQAFVYPKKRKSSPEVPDRLSSHVSSNSLSRGYTKT
jgi:hypothetical protein